MKNCKAFFFVLLTLLSSFILISCAEEEDVIPSSEVVESVSSFLLSEDGLVLTRLTDEGEEEGNYFTSYLFQFEENGRVVPQLPKTQLKVRTPYPRTKVERNYK